MAASSSTCTRKSGELGELAAGDTVVEVEMDTDARLTEMVVAGDVGRAFAGPTPTGDARPSMDLLPAMSTDSKRGVRNRCIVARAGRPAAPRAVGTAPQSERKGLTMAAVSQRNIGGANRFTTR